ncbi:unnamed protein product [Caenorhabditis auriculariae]|uniref:Domain of unknown function DX domain-containing protein n=1 Tax=Caenorhabditis auriculariae TaxID=2777116 RepID=A0A8S1H109_9PELO|nr:unnamed protein product [Caenorhabditis auriculariae]
MLLKLKLAFFLALVACSTSQEVQQTSEELEGHVANQLGSLPQTEPSAEPQQHPHGNPHGIEATSEKVEKIDKEISSNGAVDGGRKTQEVGETSEEVKKTEDSSNAESDGSEPNEKVARGEGTFLKGLEVLQEVEEAADQVNKSRRIRSVKTGGFFVEDPEAVQEVRATYDKVEESSRRSRRPRGIFFQGQEGEHCNTFRWCGTDLVCFYRTIHVRVYNSTCVKLNSVLPDIRPTLLFSRVENQTCNSFLWCADPLECIDVKLSKGKTESRCVRVPQTRSIWDMSSSMSTLKIVLVFLLVGWSLGMEDRDRKKIYDDYFNVPQKKGFFFEELEGDFCSLFRWCGDGLVCDYKMKDGEPYRPKCIRKPMEEPKPIKPNWFFTQLKGERCGWTAWCASHLKCQSIEVSGIASLRCIEEKLDKTFRWNR